MATPCSYEKFLLYIYLCAAYADYKIDDDEKHVIFDRIKRWHTIEASEFEDLFHSVSREFRNHNDYESMQYIENCVSQLSLNEVEKERIYTELYTVVLADGTIDNDEKANMFRIRKMLGLTAG